MYVWSTHKLHIVSLLVCYLGNSTLNYDKLTCETCVKMFCYIYNRSSPLTDDIKCYDWIMQMRSYFQDSIIFVQSSGCGDNLPLEGHQIKFDMFVTLRRMWNCCNTRSLTYLIMTEKQLQDNLILTLVLDKLWRTRACVGTWIAMLIVM